MVIITLEAQTETDRQQSTHQNVNNGRLVEVVMFSHQKITKGDTNEPDVGEGQRVPGTHVVSIIRGRRKVFAKVS